MVTWLDPCLPFLRPESIFRGGTGRWLVVWCGGTPRISMGAVAGGSLASAPTIHDLPWMVCLASTFIRKNGGASSHPTAVASCGRNRDPCPVARSDASRFTRPASRSRVLRPAKMTPHGVTTNGRARPSVLTSSPTCETPGVVAVLLRVL